MSYGLFRGDEHIYTYDYKHVAERQVSTLGSEYYIRELTFDEYYKRMKEIYVEGKYK